MIVKMFLINAFTDGLFSGGRALVAILRRPGQTHVLQALACELRTPVTAFVLPYQEGFAVRYFSEAGELDSGGYAALAVAKALYFVGVAPPDQPLRLDGLKGPALIRPVPGPGRELSLILPPAPAQEELPPPDWLQRVSGLDQDAVLGFLVSGPHRLLCLAEHPVENFPAAALASAATENRPENRLIISWPLDEGGYGLRCFGPAGEETELPLALDFHAALGPFWVERLGRNRLEVHHLAFRPGLIWLKITAEAVELSGHLEIVYKAVPTLGELMEQQTI